MRKPLKVKLIKSHPHRWGQGKTHLAIREAPHYYVTACTRSWVHAELIDGTTEDITCKRCLKGPPR